MKLIPLTSCDFRFFDFQPHKTWPKGWPPFSWNQKLITGFSHCDHPYALEFNNSEKHEKYEHFSHLFHTCYPQLNLPEFGRILNKWGIKQLPGFSWQNFFALYNYHQDLHFLKNFFTKLLATPNDFQNWVTEKKVHINDLRILNCIPNINDLSFMFQWISEKNVSHFHGVKALELAGELILMEFKEAEILNEKLKDNPQAMIQHIELKRKNKTLSQDQKKQQQLEHTIWPNQTQGQWVRKGDQTGLEIKLWCKNQNEMQKKLKSAE